MFFRFSSVLVKYQTGMDKGDEQKIQVTNLHGSDCICCIDFVSL